MFMICYLCCDESQSVILSLFRDGFLAIWDWIICSICLWYVFCNESMNVQWWIAEERPVWPDIWMEQVLNYELLGKCLIVFVSMYFDDHRSIYSISILFCNLLSATFAKRLKEYFSESFSGCSHHNTFNGCCWLSWSFKWKWRF